MAELTYPGVYIEEVPSAPAPIQGVSPSTLAVVGFTEAGPVDKPVLVTSIADFQAKFGGFISNGLAPLMLLAFFRNGGSRAAVVRVVGAGALPSSGALNQQVAPETIGAGDGIATVLSATISAAPVLPGSLVINYVSTTPQVITDNGAGALTGAGTGTIDYDTGDISITFSGAPDDMTNITATVREELWPAEIKWPGVAGDKYRVTLAGTPGFEVDDEATFSRWTLRVLRDVGGAFEVVETFDALDFDTPASPNFVTRKVNDPIRGSQIVTVQDIGKLGVPSELSGSALTGEVVGAGDGTETGFADTLAGGSASPTTVVLTFTAAAVTRTVTDDGNGNLIGDVNPAGANTIDYATGAFDVILSVAPTNATNVTAAYYTRPAALSTAIMGGGSDGAAVTSTEVVAGALEPLDRGLFALNQSDELFSVIIPDFAGNELVDGVLVDYCEARKDRFAILTTPLGVAPQVAINYKRFSLARNSSFYGIYYPWIVVADPVTNNAITVPPLGHVAGVFARTDNNKNVGKAPAGIEDGGLRYVVALERSLTRGDVGLLNPQRVNALVDWPQLGQPAVWGARTGQTGGDFGYVQTRRLFMFVEKSVFEATHRYVFENNGTETWAKIKLQLNGFLLRLFGLGYFAGDTAEEAFFIVVDESNNPPEAVDAGILTVDVGIASNKPAEFLVFRFAQIAQAS